MKKSYELEYHRLEKSHWWFEARRSMIFKLIKGLDRGSLILDVGCSGGQLIEFLQQRGFNNVCGIDVSSGAVNSCVEKGLRDILLMDAAELKFDKRKFDLIIASDILEHIESDYSALASWNGIMEPGGKLIIFVPAFRFLWGRIDELNDHFRRYSRMGLSYLLKGAGFEIERCSYWNFSLFFPAVLLRIFQRMLLKNSGEKIGQVYGLCELNIAINSFLKYLLKFENRFLENLDLPAGVSLFAVARKK